MTETPLKKTLSQSPHCIRLGGKRQQSTGIHSFLCHQLREREVDSTQIWLVLRLKKKKMRLLRFWGVPLVGKSWKSLGRGEE